MMCRGTFFHFQMISVDYYINLSRLCSRHHLNRTYVCTFTAERVVGCMEDAL